MLGAPVAFALAGCMFGCVALLRVPLVWMLAGLGGPHAPLRAEARAVSPSRARPTSPNGDWVAVFSQFLLLSVLSIGGAIGTAPEMHRFLVEQHHWMTNEQFSASVAIAQAAPGPNLLFVAVLGWGIGGFFGMCVTMTGILLPSTTLTLLRGALGRGAPIDAARCRPS